MNIVYIVAEGIWDYKYRIYHSIDEYDISINQISRYLQIACDLFFITDTIMSIITKGLLEGKNSYLKNSYNWINLICIICSIGSRVAHEDIQPYFAPAKMLRIIRIMQFFPIIKNRLSSLISTLPELSKVIIGLIAIMTIYALIGLHIFQGALEFRCRFESEPTKDGLFEYDPTQKFLCGKQSVCNEGTYCRAPFQYDVHYEPEEAYTEILDFGYIKFDHFGWSIFTVFHIVESIGWSNMMFIHWRFFDTRVCSFFFISLLVLGFYIILNLFLGALYDGFSTRQTIKNTLKLGVEEQKKHSKEKTSIKNVIGKKNRKTYHEFTQKLFTNSSNVLNLFVKNAMDRIHQNNIPLKFKIYNFEPIKYYGYSFRRTFEIFGFIKAFYESKYFTLFSYLTIIINFIVLCLDRYPIQENQLQNLILTDFILTTIYLFEMIIRVNYCLSLRIYFIIVSFFQSNFLIKLLGAKKKVFNSILDVVDLFILLLNIIVLVAGFSNGQNMLIRETKKEALIKCLKGWRIFRILIEMTLLYPLSTLVEAFFKTFKGLFYHTVICMIFVIAFSILGMNLFAYRARFEEEIELAHDPIHGKSYVFNFDNFGQSLISVLLCFLNEEWHLIQFYYMHAVGNVASLFFIIVICVGEITLMRLFLAIYIQNYLIIVRKKEVVSFEDQADLQVKGELIEQLSPEKKRELIERTYEMLAPGTYDVNQRFNNDQRISSNHSNLENQLKFNSKIVNNQEQPRRSLTQKNKSDKYEDNNNLLDFLNVDKYQRSRLNSDDKNILKLDNLKPLQSFNTQQKKNKSLSVLNNDFLREPSLSNNQNIYLSKESIYRENTGKKNNSQITNKIEDTQQIQFLKSKYFENIIVILIFGSGIVMGLSDPLEDPQSMTELALRYIDISIVLIFILEGCLKSFAYGIYNNSKESYLRNFWNIIDLISIVISVGVFFFSDSLRFINGFRAIRIVKLSQRIESVRIVMISIIKSMPTVIKLLIFAFASLSFLGLFPLKYFKGKYYYCANQTYEEIHTKWDCMDTGGDWVPQDLRWDNILRSSYNIFIISTCEGWSFMLQKAYGATNVKVDYVPGLATQSDEWSAFFISAFVIGNKMIFNSFIGVLIEKFNQIKNFYSPYRGLKNEEKEWAIIKEGIIKSKPKKAVVYQFNLHQFKISTQSLGIIRRYLNKLIDKNKNFQRFDDICTISNTFVFMLYYHRMDSDYKDILDYINFGFLMIFGIQLLMKIILYQKIFFTKSVWNCFEFFLFMFSLIGVFLKFSIKNPEYEINALLNFMQVIRSCRIIPIFKSAVELLGTIALVLPSVGPIALFFCFVLFIWTLIGLNLFPYLKEQQYINGYDLSFRDFTSTVASLIRVAQSEFWFGLVVDAGREQQPNFVCYNMKNYDDFKIHGFNGCGDEISAYLYFFSFHLIVSIMIVNLLLALIIDGSAEAFKIQDAALNRYQLDQIQDLWMEYDKDGQGFISYKDFWQFSSRISIIYGVQQEDLLDINHKKDFLKVLQIPIYELIQKNEKGQETSQFGYIYHDVIIKLTAISVIIKYGASESINDESSIKDTTLLSACLFKIGSHLVIQRRYVKYHTDAEEDKKMGLKTQALLDSQKLVKNRSDKLSLIGNIQQSGDEDIISLDQQIIKQIENAFEDKFNSLITKDILNPSQKFENKQIQSIQVQNPRSYFDNELEKFYQFQTNKGEPDQRNNQLYQEETPQQNINFHANLDKFKSLRGDDDKGMEDEIKF